MTDKPISSLRQRMIDDMTVCGSTPSTQRGYFAAVTSFTRFLGRSPDRAEADDLRRFQLEMRSRRGYGDNHERRRLGPAIFLLA